MISHKSFGVLDNSLRNQTKLNRYGCVFFLIIGVFLRTSAFARMPEMRDPKSSSEWIEREGHTLFLNGKGIHTVSIFKARVYKISLYLEKRSKDPLEILNSSERKVIILKFLREIDAEQLRSAFKDGFRENCENQCQKLKPYLNQLNSAIPDLKEGDSFEFLFSPTRLVLKSSLGNYLEIKSPAFERVLLSIWLGSSPPSSQLKNKILGIK